MNNRSISLAILPIALLTLVLTGCGGGSGSGSALTGSDSASALGKVVTDTTTVVAVSPSPTASPTPDGSPSPCPSPTGSPDHGKPTDGSKPAGDPKPKDDARPKDDSKPEDRPVRGGVKSVDATALTFVVAPPPKPADEGKTSRGKKEGTPKESVPPVPKDITVTTDSTTTFVRKNGKDTADTLATFTEIAEKTQVAVFGAVNKETATVTATRVEILPPPPVKP